jgi:hypothetical protein
VDQEYAELAKAGQEVKADEIAIPAGAEERACAEDVNGNLPAPHFAANAGSIQAAAKK